MITHWAGLFIHPWCFFGGVRSQPWDGFAHIGPEMWTKNPYPGESSHPDGAKWLTLFADVVGRGKLEVPNTQK